MLAILISNRRTAISWGFLGSSCNQLITQHRFNKLPTNENPPKNPQDIAFIAGRGKRRVRWFRSGKKNTQIKIQYDKTTMCPFIQVPKFPTYWQRKLPKEKTLESPCFPRGYRIVMKSTSILIAIKWVSIRSSIESGGIFRWPSPYWSNTIWTTSMNFMNSLRLGKKCIQNDG